MTDSATELIVLTGCGWVTPFAAGSIGAVLTAAGDAAHGPPAEAAYWAVPDDLRADHLNLSKEIRNNKAAWMTAVALERARREAGLKPDSVAPPRVGLALGCALAGQLGMIEFANEVRQQTPRFVSPIHFPQTVGNYVAGALARGYGIRGPNVTLSSGAASGLDAIVEACRLLHAGDADVVFAGGTDCMSDALALGLSRPETVLSEGACLFLLERAEHAAQRGAVPLATLTGCGHPATASMVANAGIEDTLTRPADGGIVSAAGIRRPRAVWIEHWVGHCFAALGAAAAAGAIGAAGGLPVPLTDAIDVESVSIGTITSPCPRHATIIADADGAHVTSLQLAATSGGS